MNSLPPFILSNTINVTKLLQNIRTLVIVIFFAAKITALTFSAWWRIILTVTKLNTHNGYTIIKANYSSWLARQVILASITCYYKP